MNEIDKKYFKISVVGKGKEYFQSLQKEEEKVFSDKHLYFGIGEGFSAPEITQVLISIGSSVIAGLSTYYIVKLIDKIYKIKSDAEEKGQKFNITVSIEINNNIYSSSNVNEIKQIIEKESHSISNKDEV